MGQVIYCASALDGQRTVIGDGMSFAVGQREAAKVENNVLVNGDRQIPINITLQGDARLDAIRGIVDLLLQGLFSLGAVVVPSS